jgi:hypothetical protein
MPTYSGSRGARAHERADPGRAQLIQADQVCVDGWLLVGFEVDSDVDRPAGWLASRRTVQIGACRRSGVGVSMRRALAYGAIAMILAGCALGEVFADYGDPVDLKPQDLVGTWRSVHLAFERLASQPNRLGVSMSALRQDSGEVWLFFFLRR